MTLSSCGGSIELPDFDGLPAGSIEDYFELKDIDYEINYITDGVTEDNSGLFKGYVNYEVGDKVSVNKNIEVDVYERYENLIFETVDMVYDGPLLSVDYENVDPIDPRGGYFDVTLIRCGDGDTAVFDYPVEIYELIYSGAKSTRFLNMDTEETYTGGEEEWGKPASVYTCELLTEATEIRLQSDPGDALTGTYGRLLAWIWIKLPDSDEFQLLNYMVVKQGLAQVKYEFGAGLDLENNGKSYNEWMHFAEDYAEVNELGQWGDKLDYYWDYEDDKPDYLKWRK